MGILPSMVAAQTVMREEKKKGGNPMPKEETEQLAAIVVDRLQDIDTLVLIMHSMPEAEGLGGIVVNPDIAARTPCTCYGNVCFSRGIIGALNESEREAYCPSTVQKTSPAMTKRLEKWQEAKDICKTKASEYPKGERLVPYSQCMGVELSKRGIEI
jgi:hypothetical protein